MDSIALTAGEIASLTGGRLIAGDPKRRIERFSIDSRTIAPGELFIAIRGDRFDGHQFAGAALAAGAVGAVLSEEAFGGERDVARAAPIIIRVDDTTRALQEIARGIRRLSGARVVAITGSAGKTTTKELTAAFLAAKHSVFRNQGNLNNHIGLPLSLLEMRNRPDVAVVELGMNHAGEIRTLVGIAEPDVRVWTNVGDAHLGFFSSVDEMADAKAEILENARSVDLLVANADDERVVARIRRFTGRTITFGFGERATIRAIDVQHRGLEGTTATLSTSSGSIRLATPLLGTGNLSNLLAATAVATEFGIALNEIAERAASMKPAPHRGELVHLPGGLTVIDDSYNSSPSALKRALETVRAASGCARKVAILGEMLELGVHSSRLHAECGQAAAGAGLDLLVTVGGDGARALADAARNAGLHHSAVFHVPSSGEAADLASHKVRPGDLVLVKGSRGVRTDVVVDRLKAEFA